MDLKRPEMNEISQILEKICQNLEKISQKLVHFKSIWLFVVQKTPFLQRLCSRHLIFTMENVCGFLLSIIHIRGGFELTSKLFFHRCKFARPPPCSSGFATGSLVLLPCQLWYATICSRISWCTHTAEKQRCSIMNLWSKVFKVVLHFENVTILNTWCVQKIALYLNGSCIKSFLID